MKKLLCIVLAVILALSVLCACSSMSKVTDEMFALDTFITFTVYDNNEALCDTVIDDCKAEITRLENLLSATKEGSDVYNINNSHGEQVLVSDETAGLIKRACELSESCDGAFDISVYPLVTLWGFDTKDYTVPSDEEIEKTLASVSYKDITVSDNSVTLKDGMSIDLGAIAKGYIGECVREVLSDSGISRAVVNLGGTVILYNSSDDDENFTVGVEHPDTAEVFATISTKEHFTVTSGAYQRYFELDGVRYHHIIDTTSGKPSDSDISSVTVIGSDGVANDALTTAFYVMGVDETLEYLKTHTDETGQLYSFVILSDDFNTLYVSADLVESGFELESDYEEIISVNVVDLTA